MKKYLSVLFLTASLAVSSVASAAIINIFDGDTVDASSTDTHQLVGGLTASNLMYTVGFWLGDGVNISPVTINAPDEFFLRTAVSLGPDRTGGILSTPGSGLKLDAGSIWEVDLNPFSHLPQVFVTVSIDQAFVDDGKLDLFPGGTYTGNTFFAGSGFTSVPNPVPEPSSILLAMLALALLGLIKYSAKKEDFESMRAVNA